MEADSGNIEAVAEVGHRLYNGIGVESNSQLPTTKVAGLSIP